MGNVVAGHVSDTLFSRRRKVAGGARRIKLLIFCPVRGGMGDVFFAKNLRDYIVKWCAQVGLRIRITTLLASVEGKEDAERKATIAGYSREEIITESLGRSEGFTSFYSALRPEQPLGTFDLYFLAPVNMDVAYGKVKREYPLRRGRDAMHIPIKEIILYDLQPLFNNLTMDNMITFSVYNGEELLGTDDIDFFKNTDYDFATGIGEGKYGIMQPADVLLAECDADFLVKHGLAAGKYALVYVDTEQEHVNDCIEEFVKRVVRKYESLTVVMPVKAWNAGIEQFLIDLSTINNLRLIHDGKIIKDGEGGTLNIRTDVLPLVRKEFICLLKHSVREVLLTGNQSVSDIATCCPDKLLTYQVSTWTRAFGKAVGRFADTCGEKPLAEEWAAPSQSLADITSDWDFERKARRRVLSILARFAKK